MVAARRTYDALRLWAQRRAGHEDEWKERFPDAWAIVMQIQRLKNG
jgi:hypothetical protein